EEFAVVKDMRVHIDSVVDITVRPGQSSAELDRAVESAQAGLDAELERLGVESLDQARHRAEERASAEAVLAEANSTLRVLIGSDDRAGLDPALARAEHLAGESAESSEPGNEPAGIDELETAVESTAQPSMPHRRPSTPRERLSSALGPTGTRLGWQPFGRRRPTNRRRRQRRI